MSFSLVHYTQIHTNISIIQTHKIYCYMVINHAYKSMARVLLNLDKNKGPSYTTIMFFWCVWHDIVQFLMGNGDK